MEQEEVVIAWKFVIPGRNGSVYNFRAWLCHGFLNVTVTTSFLIIEQDDPRGLH